MTCSCGEKMKKYEQPPRFGMSFIFWKCRKCGRLLKEEIGGVDDRLDSETNSSNQSAD